MKIRIPCIAACAAALAFATPALASPEKPAASHDSKCVQEARALKGEERDKALAECPKARGEHSQQNKMRTCNDEARTRDLHGDERRAFMSTCLKG